METKVKRLVKPTDFAKLFKEKVDKEVEQQQEDDDNKCKEEGKEPKTVDVNAVRSRNLEALHVAMDEACEKRKYRLQFAAAKKTRTPSMS